MKLVIITKDRSLEDIARMGFQLTDEVLFFEDWQLALEACGGADLLFVDLIATLTTPNKIAGYESFGAGKMAHAIACSTPLVLISPDAGYELDFMVGWEGFVFANVQRPVTAAIFARARLWV